MPREKDSTTQWNPVLRWCLAWCNHKCCCWGEREGGSSIIEGSRDSGGSVFRGFRGGSDWVRKCCTSHSSSLAESLLWPMSLQLPRIALFCISQELMDAIHLTSIMTINEKKKPLNALSTNNSTSLSLSPCPNKRLKYQRWLPKEPVYVCLLKRCCISRLLMLPVSMSWVTGGSESYITSSVALFNSSDLSSWSRREGREGEGDRMLLLPSRECLADKHFWSCCGMIKFTYRQ